MMAIVTEAAAFAALFIVAWAAAIDAVKFEIPDSASLAIGALALIFCLLEPGIVWWSHLGAPLLMFGFGLLAFSRGWLGGGDVKLMTAVAAWTGLAGFALMFIATSIAGGLLALVLMIARRLATAQDERRGRVSQPAKPLPYAVAIALGTLWWLWATGGGPLAAHYAVGNHRPVARAIAT